MKYALTQVAFGLGANALIARNAPQCVQLKASGGASGVLGQLDDGQNRIGGGHPTGCYCLSDGGFTDSNGRGCILTPPTTQFQCDVGASPTSGFTIGSDGSISYNGNGKFYACPVNDNKEYNVYTTPAPGQDKCVEISLASAGSCGSGYAPPAESSKAPEPSKPAPSKPAESKPAPEPSKPAPSKPAESKPAPEPSKPAPSKPAESKPAPEPSKPAPSKPAESKPAPKPEPQPEKPSGSCPADLNGAYQFPHLIVPVHSDQPSKPSGTSYFGTVDSKTCTIFNFDIPSSYSDKTCTVVFLFPEQKDLETSSYTVSGSGKVTFSKLKSAANQDTCWDNAPAKESDIGSWAVAPGNSYTIASGSCAAGQTVSYEICSDGDFSLNYFQDYNPSPIGMYIRQC